MNKKESEEKQIKLISINIGNFESTFIDLDCESETHIVIKYTNEDNS